MSLHKKGKQIFAECFLTFQTNLILHLVDHANNFLGVLFNLKIVENTLKY